MRDKLINKMAEAIAASEGKIIRIESGNCFVVDRELEAYYKTLAEAALDALLGEPELLQQLLNLRK